MQWGAALRIVLPALDRTAGHDGDVAAPVQLQRCRRRLRDIGANDNNRKDRKQCVFLCVIR